jgi:hypothetical protein
VQGDGRVRQGSCQAWEAAAKPLSPNSSAEASSGRILRTMTFAGSVGSVAGRRLKKLSFSIESLTAGQGRGGGR